jgi:uncharacterized protein YjaZ
MMVTTYEVLGDKDFNRKFKECKVDGSARECRGFTVLPAEDSADLLGPHKLCQVYVRANQDTKELQSTLAHETVHVLQYLCDVDRLEGAAYLLENVIHEIIHEGT